MTGQRQRDHIRRNLPPGWGLLFAYVPGRSSKIRCLLCGRTGHGYHGQWVDKPDFAGRRIMPAPWQLACIGGHTVQCIVCRRPFIHGGAVAKHQNCKLHHACCLDHTTVPAWKNPFHLVAA